MVDVPVMVGFTRDEGLINSVRLFKDRERAEMANREPERCMAQNTLGVVRETCDEMCEDRMREAIRFGNDHDYEEEEDFDEDDNDCSGHYHYDNLGMLKS